MSSDSLDNNSWKRYRDKYRSISSLAGESRGRRLAAEENLATPRTTSLLSDPTLRRHLAAALRVPENSVDTAVSERARGVTVSYGVEWHEVKRSRRMRYVRDRSAYRGFSFE